MFNFFKKRNKLVEKSDKFSYSMGLSDERAQHIEVALGNTLSQAIAQSGIIHKPEILNQVIQDLGIHGEMEYLYLGFVFASHILGLQQAQQKTAEWMQMLFNNNQFVPMLKENKTIN